MENMTTAKYENGGLTLFLSGRIDSTNSAQVEKDVFAAVVGYLDIECVQIWNDRAEIFVLWRNDGDFIARYAII